MVDTLLVSSAETPLKSRYVRSMLERRLADQIRLVLSINRFNDVKIHRSQARIYIEAPELENASEIVSRVFGVSTLMPSSRSSPDFEDIVNKAVDVAKNTIQMNESFAVRAKAYGKHVYTSQDLATRIGSDILQSMQDKQVQVNLDHPDRVIYVEAQEAGFIYTEILHGPGGYPYGSQGRLLALFSGGIDSPVATWMMMKRGADVTPLFFDQRPYVGTSYYERAIQAADIISKHVPKRRFDLYVANFGAVMEKILSTDKPALRCVLCKRSMYRVASKIATNLNSEGLVTGESLGQVASQTLGNLAVLSEAATVPVYRPLIGLDKVEIEGIAKRIGTYHATARRVEGCTVIPNKPKTRSNLDAVREVETQLGLTVLEDRIPDEIQCVRFSKE